MSERGWDGDMAVQWWLAELDRYGNPKLIDGAHSKREGGDVEDCAACDLLKRAEVMNLR